jgi:cytochrome c556
MLRRLRIALGIVALAFLVPPLSGDSSVPQKAQDGNSKKVSELMRKKLEHAQKVLEGIAIHDLDKVLNHADALMQLSKEIEWQVIKTPRYEVQSNEFRRAVESLQEKATQKNLDGVALGYVELTLSCVKCHKYVREVRMTRLDQRRDLPPSVVK